MSRYATISTIGMRSEHGASDAKYEQILQACVNRLQREIEQVLPNQPDLIVIPEFCDHPFQLEGSVPKALEYYGVRGEAVRDFLSGIARENGCYITYPAFTEAEGVRTNSIQMIDRSGNVVGKYDKSHVTIGEMEEYDIRCGAGASVIECDFGRVGCAICFDLNFDELRLRYSELKPDLLIFSSMYHGGIMQRYWAYSCRAHFVGAVWNDESAILSPTGEMIASSSNYFNFTSERLNFDCALAHLDFNGDRLKSLKAKCGAGVTIHAPDHLGSVLITNEMGGCTVGDLIREFEIERLDEYFARARAMQKKYRL